jgi:two-component system, response regulator FlrC
VRLLTIGAVEAQLTMATKIAVDKGTSVTHADRIDGALAVLRSGKGADLLMVDIATDIRDLVLRLDAEHIHVPIVACGTQNDACTAVAAVRAGAKEYIPLPPDSEMIAAILAAVAGDTRELVYRDEAMASLMRLARRLAQSDRPILITGESGTGKEMLARYVHSHSPGRRGTFVSANCAAIPERFLESELFGHEKGAFTGAVARRVGKFEQANGGTLLLAEVSEMDERVEAKVLRALQNRLIHGVGSNRPVPVDIRVIATSKHNLGEAARGSAFREDLTSRLNMVNLKIPPLRERPSDIVELAEHFVRKYAEANGVALRALSTEAKRRLALGRWPGNVRELENTMHRAVLVATGEEIGPADVAAPDGVRTESTKPRAVARAALAAEAVTRALVGRTVADVERDLILETLKHCFGNRTHAANILGISIRTLRNKLTVYAADGVRVPPPNGGEIRGAA